ncbi:unnamed protein product [Caenorhabditis sp. 36 PRJEB53466]|nr:unnamed protein product [Caenorhabditis sp. 36 PRJEB53466]
MADAEPVDDELAYYYRSSEDCTSGRCAICTVSSEAALSMTKQLSSAPNETVQEHRYFPLDDRVLLDIPVDHPDYFPLAKRTIETFQDSLMFVNLSIPEPGKTDLDSVLLVTNEGILFVITKMIDVHASLKFYDKWIQTMRARYPPTSHTSYPNRNPKEPDVLFLSEFQQDKTSLRRTRFIGNSGENEYFLELDTGMIRKMHHRESDKDAQLFRVFQPTPPGYMRCYLRNREKMTVSDILNKAIRIAKDKKINILQTDFDCKNEPHTIVDEFIENPLEGMWSDESDDE